MKFKWDIVGHQEQLQSLERDFVNENYAHAYLFVGENHLGKTTVARQLAQNLQEGLGDLDTVEVLGRKEILKVGDVRGLIDRAQMTSQAPFKVFIIQNIERMNRESANAFLKTLEEPPERTIFILTTASLAQVLPTVVSRTRVVKFFPLKERVLDESYDEVRALVAGLKGQNIAERFMLVDRLVENKEEGEMFLEVLLREMRKHLIEGRANAEATIKKLCKIEDTGILLEKNVNARLVFENLMMEL